MRWRAVGTALADTAAVAGRTVTALLGAIITVRLFVHSGSNAADVAAMPLVLAQGLAAAGGEVWPLVAPWVGALGSFIAGSATFSNLLFALLQFEVAQQRGHVPERVLALQMVGAAAGNMVCVHNVVAACAVAGILGREGEVIRRTALPMAAYLLVAGALGALF